MNVWDVSAGKFLLASAAAAEVKLGGGDGGGGGSGGGCVPDVLGFCYSAPLATPLVLEAGQRYYIVSEEHTGGDSYAEMTDSATSTNFVVRDGR